MDINQNLMNFVGLQERDVHGLWNYLQKMNNV